MVPVSTNMDERNRAKLARCLARWRRPEGGKIPGTEEGIAEHQGLVVVYTELYGPPTDGSRRQYESTYQNIRFGLLADQESKARMIEFNEQQAAQKRQQEEQLAANERAMIERSLVRDARQTLSVNAETMPYMQEHLSRLQRYIDADTKRCKQLNAILTSGKYDNAPKLAGQIRKNLEHAQSRMEDYMGRAAGIQSNMDLRNRQDEEAKSVIARFGATDDDILSDTEEAANALIESSWNRTPYSKFRELKTIPREWECHKVVLIWRGEGRQELRVFADDDDLADNAVYGLLGDDAIVSQLESKPDRCDYVLTREQYERASNYQEGAM